MAVLTIDELARQVGMTTRNIRAHQTRGLLHAPKLKGRTAFYDNSHVDRLAVLQQLQSDGWSLDEIAGTLAVLPPQVTRPDLVRALVHSMHTGEPLIVEPSLVAELWGEGITEEDLARGRRIGYVRELPDGRFELPSATLVAATAECARLGIPLTAVLELADRAWPHLEAVAEHAAEMLSTLPVPNDADPDEALQAALVQLTPLVMTSAMALLNYAFKQALPPPQGDHPMTGRIVLFGATGYAGGLVLDSLLHRGVKPVLAGRNGDALAEIAERFGRLEYALADAMDAASVANLLGRGDVLISTVGPFERFGHAVARAAADSGAHYVDSTGEIGFVLDLRKQLDDRARETGAVMLPAFGYDYVPGVLAGALAASEGGDAVRSIDIGYFATGSMRRGLSQGTRTTVRDGLTLPVYRWRNHQLVEQRVASTVQSFPVRGRRKSAFLVSGTEVLDLPAAFPELDTVSVYNGLFPALSFPTAVMSAGTAVVARIPLGRKMIDIATHPIIGPAGGPDAAERARTRSHVVAIARDVAGETAAEVHLEGPSVYSLTGVLMGWAAEQLAAGAGRAAGVVGPIDAFGLGTLRDGCNEIGLSEVSES